MSKQVLAENVIPPNELVKLLLSNPWIGFILFATLVLSAIAISIWIFLRQHKPLVAALKLRLDATRIVANSVDHADAQDAFAENFDAIDVAMRDQNGGRGSKGLSHAWAEFSETILDKSISARPMQATTRPDSYFLHLGDDTKVLAWWANIFVAVGLTATFLGIIAALTGAVEGMQQAGSGQEMTGPLITLLVITSGKFWTSIGGVLGSIILRACDRLWHSQTLRLLDNLCERIEAGTDYVPSQRIAVDQLRAIRQQGEALTEFSHQLAAAIGDALGQHMTPVVQGLAGIQTSIDDIRSGSFNAIGEEFGKALKQNAGAEMAQLAGALTQMTSKLDGVKDQLDGASAEASDQIATAAHEFSAASEVMSRVFGQLGSKIEAMGTNLQQQTADAEQRQADRVRDDRAAYREMADNQKTTIDGATEALVKAVADAVKGVTNQQNAVFIDAIDKFSAATTGIQAAFDKLKGQIAAMGTIMAERGEATANSNAEVLARAATALEAALGRTQIGMDDALRKALEQASKVSQDALGAAFAEFGARFEDASTGLVSTLVTSTGRMEVAAQAFERSGSAVGDHAIKITEAGREVQQVSVTLGRAATDVASAAGPIRDATRAISESTTATQVALRNTQQAVDGQIAALDSMKTGFDGASAAATRAWESYRERFDSVDEALADALGSIAAATAEHAETINTQVGRVDGGLAKAVETLGGSLAAIEDLAASLDDLRQRAR